MTQRFKLHTVSRDILAHARERRGFVNVPLDYRDHGDPELGTIDVFYRLLPRHGVPLDGDTSPLIVVINGGPGIASHFYRPLDFDYEANLPPRGGLDRFRFLLEDFRVVIFDQRGTDGGSAPLDMEDPDLDPYEVARLFSSDSHARDAAALIAHLVPKDAPFFIIAQSYGGLPGMQYLALEGARRPAGIVFSSSALPFEDAVEQMLHRRSEQRRLNLALRDAVPDIESRLAATRAHLTAIGLEEDLVHCLWVNLGKGITGEWEPALVKRLDRIRGQTREEVLADMEHALETPSLLNYILSSANFSEGHTDRTLAALGSEQIPFESWMIDEHVMLMQTGQDGGWRQALVARLDEKPPAFIAQPSLEVLRAAIGQTQALFTAADNDAMVPRPAYEASVRPFLVDGHAALEFLPGGHNAIFLEEGARLFKSWAGRVLGRVG